MNRLNRGRVELLVYTRLGRALSALPEPAALAAAALVGEALFHLRPEARRVVTRNIRRVVGTELDQSSLDRWVKRSFRAYARYWVEGARLAKTPASEIMQRVVTEGLVYLTDAMATGNGVVMALPHVGSWEYGGAYLALKGFPMTAVAERIEPPELFDYFVRERAAMGLTVIPLGPDSGAAVVQRVRQGGLVGLLCDRDLNQNGIDVEFFGEITTMPAGPATVALRTGATLLVAAVYSGPGCDHRAVVLPPIDTTRTGSFRSDVHRITQEIAIRFEGLIRQAPEQWHVFQPLWPIDRPSPGK